MRDSYNYFQYTFLLYFVVFKIISKHPRCIQCISSKVAGPAWALRTQVSVIRHLDTFKLHLLSSNRKAFNLLSRLRASYVCNQQRFRHNQPNRPSCPMFTTNSHLYSLTRHCYFCLVTLTEVWEWWNLRIQRRCCRLKASGRSMIVNNNNKFNKTKIFDSITANTHRDIKIVRQDARTHEARAEKDWEKYSSMLIFIQHSVIFESSTSLLWPYCSVVFIAVKWLQVLSNIAD